MSVSVTAYLTPDQIPAVEVIERKSDNSTIYLMPTTLASKSLPKIINVHILSQIRNPVECKEKPKLTAGHAWLPDPAADGATAPFLATDTMLHADLPHTPFWSGATIEPQIISAIAMIGPFPDQAPCPELKTDVLSIPADGWDLFIKPVPGEELKITHSSYVADDFSLSVYHSCPALTGGKIVAKWEHPTVSGAFLYDVEVEGLIFDDVIPMDFEEYNVSDWCFLLRSIDATKNLEFKAEIPEGPKVGEVLRIAPLSVAGV